MTKFNTVFTIARRVGTDNVKFLTSNGAFADLDKSKVVMRGTKKRLKDAVPENIADIVDWNTVFTDADINAMPKDKTVVMTVKVPETKDDWESFELRMKDDITVGELKAFLEKLPDDMTTDIDFVGVNEHANFAGFVFPM